MKRISITIASLLVTLALLNHLRVRERGAGEPAAKTVEQGQEESDEQTVVLPSQAPAEEARDEVPAVNAAPAASGGFVPTYFPKAKIVARVADPADAQGRRRVIETVETNMKERFVRVERTFRADGKPASAEVAMVANQLLLEKPAAVAVGDFVVALKKAGALEVKQIGEAFLATFSSKPEDPRALDAYLSRVKEVAGADVTVEPNYIRKMF